MIIRDYGSEWTYSYAIEKKKGNIKENPSYNLISDIYV